MTKLIKGTRLRHQSKADWGVGQVLEDENGQFVKIFFEGAGEVSLAPSALSKLTVISGTEAQSMLLDHMHLPGEGKTEPMVTIQQARTRLLEKFPGGLHGPRMRQEERMYKDQLRVLAQELFGLSVANELLASGQYQEIVVRAGRLIQDVHCNFPSKFEKMRFRDGIRALSDSKAFAVALCNWIIPKVPDEAAFDAFVRELDVIECAKWPVLTTFRFLLHPKIDVMIKPENLQHAANLSRFEINYKPSLNWLTYTSVLGFYQYVKGKIADLEPADMIDVQNFICCIDPKMYPI